MTLARGVLALVPLLQSAQEICHHSFEWWIVGHIHGLCYASATYDTSMGCAMQVLCKCNLWHVHGLCYASATYDTSMGCAMPVQPMYDTPKGCAIQVQPITHPLATYIYDTSMACAMLVQPMSHAWAVLCKCHLWHVHGCVVQVPPMTCPCVPC